MQSAVLYTVLALICLVESRGVPNGSLDRRQANPECDARAPLPIGQYINETYYNGHDGPVTVSIATNGGERNKTSPVLYGWYSIVRFPP
jgi:hypothetical protein